MSSKTIILTGGGTAGHVTPNVALVPYLIEAGFNVHYIGTDGMERELISKLDNVTYHTISAGKLRRYFSLKNLSDPFRVLKGISQAEKLVRDIKPDVVFSKGGFVSVPVVMAAKGNAPIVAHESDYSPGLATKICAHYADVVCTTFDDTRKFIGKKAVYTGTPIRSALFNGNAKRGREFLGFSDTNKPVLMVMGGSLGAVALNCGLRSALDELLPKFNIAHICGKGKIDENFHCDGYTQLEYVSDELPDVFAASDVVVSRAGANSIYEYLALRKPAVLVPLPKKSSRGDQILNTDYFCKKGYSKKLLQEDITPKTFSDAVFDVYTNCDRFIAAMETDSVAKNGTRNVLNQIFAQAGVREVPQM